MGLGGGLNISSEKTKKEDKTKEKLPARMPTLCEGSSDRDESLAELHPISHTATHACNERVGIYDRACFRYLYRHILYNDRIRHPAGKALGTAKASAGSNTRAGASFVIVPFFMCPFH